MSVPSAVARATAMPNSKVWKRPVEAKERRLTTKQAPGLESSMLKVEGGGRGAVTS